jgi:hypothetical protein
MNSRIWIPAVAGALLLAACGQSDKTPSPGGDSNPGSDTAPSAAGDTATTPGGNAGDATTTPGTPSTPGDNPPPAESAPPPTEQPTNPPTTGGQ